MFFTCDIMWWKNIPTSCFCFLFLTALFRKFCQLALVLECLVQVPTMLVNEKATVISADVPATNGIIQHLGLGVGGSLEEVDKCWRLIWWSLQVVFFALSIYMCLVCLFPNSAFYMLVGVCYRLCAYRISMRRMQQKAVCMQFICISVHIHSHV